MMPPAFWPGAGVAGALVVNSTWPVAMFNDFAPFSVDYNVRYEVADATGAVVASATMPATTLPPQ